MSDCATRRRHPVIIYGRLFALTVLPAAVLRAARLAGGLASALGTRRVEGRAAVRSDFNCS